MSNVKAELPLLWPERKVSLRVGSGDQRLSWRSQRCFNRIRSLI